MLIPFDTVADQDQDTVTSVIRTGINPHVFRGSVNSKVLITPLWRNTYSVFRFHATELSSQWADQDKVVEILIAREGRRSLVLNPQVKPGQIVMRQVLAWEGY